MATNMGPSAPGHAQDGQGFSKTRRVHRLIRCGNKAIGLSRDCGSKRVAVGLACDRYATIALRCHGRPRL